MPDIQKNSSQEYKIGVVGDKESVLGFRAVGFSVFEAADTTEAENILRQIVKDNFAVIYITEELVKDMQPVLATYRSHPVPAIIAIPGKRGSEGFGLAQIKKAVERAIGADILFKENS